jgi:hypothetical protein
MIVFENFGESKQAPLDLGGSTGENQAMNCLAIIAVAVLLLLPFPTIGYPIQFLRSRLV